MTSEKKYETSARIKLQLCRESLRVMKLRTGVRAGQDQGGGGATTGDARQGGGGATTGDFHGGKTTATTGG